MLLRPGSSATGLMLFQRGPPTVVFRRRLRRNILAARETPTIDLLFGGGIRDGPSSPSTFVFPAMESSSSASPPSQRKICPASAECSSPVVVLWRSFPMVRWSLLRRGAPQAVQRSSPTLRLISFPRWRLWLSLTPLKAWSNGSLPSPFPAISDVFKGAVESLPCVTAAVPGLFGVAARLQVVGSGGELGFIHYK